jgi:dihydropteroate synthase
VAEGGVTTIIDVDGNEIEPAAMELAVLKAFAL